MIQAVGRPKVHAIAMLAWLGACGVVSVALGGIRGLFVFGLAVMAVVQGMATALAIRRREGGSDLPWCPRCGADLEDSP